MDYYCVVDNLFRVHSNAARLERIDGSSAYGGAVLAHAVRGLLPHGNRAEESTPSRMGVAVPFPVFPAPFA
jgi:hypothetical protein